MTDVGQILNERYALTRLLGSGGMAHVYLADDLTLGRQVAIKMLHPELAEDAGEGDASMNSEVGARFLREARIFASLKHPHIVDIYDVLELGDGRAAMVMEFIDGTDLSAVLGRGITLVPELAVLLLRPIADALSYAHARGVIHRDIKPANVLLGRDGTLKLSDFGIAKATEQTHITRTGAFLGTPAYIAPEQARGETIGPAADQFALGVMLYEMVTGRRPFDASTPVAILSKVLIGHYEDPRRLSKAVDERLAGVINRALADKPGKRFESLATLLDALRPEQPLDADRLRTVMADLIARPTETAQAVAQEIAATYVGMGRAALDTDRTEDARDAALKALARVPDHAEAQALLDSTPAPGDPAIVDPAAPLAFAETAESSRAEYGLTTPPVAIDGRAETADVGPSASAAVRAYRAKQAARGPESATRSGRWVVLLSIAIAALIGGGITWMLRTLPAGSNARAVAQPSGAPGVGVASAASAGLPPRTLPSDALRPVSAPPKAATTQPASGAAPTSAPPKPAPPKPTPPKPKPKPKPTAPPQAPRTAAPATAAAAQASAPGTLSVQVNPWGDLTVDGVLRSKGKLMHPPLSLSPGEHTIEVRHPKWGSRRRVVQVRSGRTTAVKVVLK